MGDGGIARHLVGADDALPSATLWNRLVDAHEIVGTCRHPGCVGPLQPLPVEVGGETGQVSWYEARCLSCGREVAAPNGRVFAHSSAHGNTPRGWLDARAARDAEDRQARGGHLPDDQPKRGRGGWR